MKNILIILTGLLMLQSCKSDRYIKNPVDEMIIELTDVKPYSIILYDMDVEGSFSHSYLHKYKVVQEDSNGELSEELTEWKQVSENYFRANENNLGMEIVSRNSEGKLSKSAAPAGYGNYVGNPKYGEWQTNNRGETFWSFYGKYMMLNTVFDLMRRPYYRDDYNHYYNGGYYGRRPYYGPLSSSGTYRYGTNSSYTKQTRPDFFSRKASKRGWSSSSSRSRSAKASRSRFSTTRSRSGGFGK